MARKEGVAQVATIMLDTASPRRPCWRVNGKIVTLAAFDFRAASDRLETAELLGMVFMEEWQVAVVVIVLISGGVGYGVLQKFGSLTGAVFASVGGAVLMAVVAIIISGQ